MHCRLYHRARPRLQVAIVYARCLRAVNHWLPIERPITGRVAGDCPCRGNARSMTSKEVDFLLCPVPPHRKDHQDDARYSVFPQGPQFQSRAPRQPNRAPLSARSLLCRRTGLSLRVLSRVSTSAKRDPSLGASPASCNPAFLPRRGRAESAVIVFTVHFRLSSLLRSCLNIEYSDAPAVESTLEGSESATGTTSLP